MLISFKDLIKQYDLQINGIIHAGAHTGEEAKEYGRLGLKPVWWIEANADTAKILRKNVLTYDGHVIEALVTDEEGVETLFHVTNYDSMSSSIFEFGTHLQSSPDTIFVGEQTLVSTTLDALDRVYHFEANFLNMDLQGAEYLALQGAKELLPRLDMIYTEVNEEEVYIGIHLMDELDEFLEDQGFDRVHTHMTPAGWGDALYLRGGLA